MLSISEQEFCGRHSDFVRAYVHARDMLFHLLSPEELAQPVIEWVTLSDRQFPRALLGRTLESLLDLPAYELVSLRGIGLMRARSVLRVLQSIPYRRAERPSLPSSESATAMRVVQPTSTLPGQWWTDACEAVRRHRLEQEPIGKFCESLAELPGPLWEEPLGTYAQITFNELEYMPGVGTNRLRLITQVYQTLYALLRAVPTHPFLSLRFLHSRIGDVDRWVNGVLHSDEVPDVSALRTHFVEPVLDQVGQDGGEDLRLLASSRIIQAKTLEQLATEVGLTRERIRQRLREVGEILRIRWSEGQFLLDDLIDKVSGSTATPAQAALVHNAFQVFYPIKRNVLYRQVLEELGQCPQDSLGLSPDAARPPQVRTANGSDSTKGYINEAILDLLGGA